MTTGIGVGLIVVMVTWLVANRVIGLMVAPPVGPVVSITVAVVGGAVTAVVACRRLVASVTE